MNIELQKIYMCKLKMKETINRYIKDETIDLEDFLYTQYKDGELNKEEYINIINDILKLEVENHLKNVISKIEKDD